MISYSSSAADAVAIRGKTTPVVSLSGPNLRVAVVPSQGGEVASLKVLHKDNWVETLHRALDYVDLKDEWRGRAPLQWPAVGRNCVPEELGQKATGQDLMMGSWRCEGKRYPMPILGFAQYMEFELVEHGSSEDSAWAECRATDCDYSRQYYPFAFELQYRHTIEGNELRTRCVVRSRESKRTMPFSIGNHITFHLPFTAAGSFEECVFTSPTTHHLELNAQDLLTGRRLPKDLRKGAQLVDKELWNMVLVGYTRENAFVELRDPYSFGFRISQAKISIGKAPRFSDIHFILYAERPYQSFCPEPWMGEPNSLNSGKAVVNLAAGEEFTWEMCVTVNWHPPCRAVSSGLMQREGKGVTLLRLPCKEESVKRLLIYADASVIGGCEDHEFAEDSQALWRQFVRGDYTLMLSEHTLREIAQAPEAVRRRLGEIPEANRIVLADSDEVDELADAYLEHRAAGSGSRADALHVALATIARADVLVSWNFKHLVNLGRIRLFNAVNLERGYAPIEVRSPKEVLGDEKII